MFAWYRLKNRLIAMLATRYPALAARLVAGHHPEPSAGAIPWTPLRKALSACTVAVVTTAGVHHPGQQPFDMNDRDGDPSFRELDGATISSDFHITHDYYDHHDAERDLNIVLPLQRLEELRQEGIIGGLARFHYGFMGHITGPHLPILTGESAPEVAERLRRADVDLVLLTPA
jgi:D-proline reductase (dithiol) PrdB